MSEGKQIVRALEFLSIDEAVEVLGQYTTQEKLKAVIALGRYNLDDYTHRELANFVKASREKVTVALGRMGMRRSPPCSLSTS